MVLEAEAASEGRLEGVFAGCFYNEATKVQEWSQVEGVGHYRWLQGPMSHLPQARQLEYIVETMLQVFDFLRF